MINSLILLSIALTALVGGLCMQLFLRQTEILKQMELQQQILKKLDVGFIEIIGTHENANKRIDQLATDVLQREIYQNSDDRHNLAIQSAKQGKGFFELMQCHGLSSDEAALIVSLHSPQVEKAEPTIKNANLVDPTILDLV